jgi:uncharacterized protein HemX
MEFETDIAKLKKMYTDLEKYAPVDNVDFSRKMVRLEEIQKRIHELEVEDIRCCMFF